MRSSGYWRWQRGGYSGRDRPAPPRVRRTGALNRRPIRSCAAAPDTRRRPGHWRAECDCRRTEAVAQARAIGHAQRRLVLEPRRSIEQPRHLLLAQHNRQLARLMNEMRVLDDGISLERDPEKEPQCRNVPIDGGCADAARHHMQLKTP